MKNKRYLEIENVIINEIVAGYKKRDKYKTESELCRQFQVSRITVRQAIGLLKEKAILETRQGSGIFVRNIPDINLTVPVLAKKNLRTNKNILVLLSAKLPTGFSHPFFSKIFQSADREAIGFGYHVFYYTTGDNYSELLSYIKTNDIGSLLIIGTFRETILEILSESNLYVVLLQLNQLVPQIPQVNNDERYGSRLAVNYLLKKGIRHIEMISRRGLLIPNERVSGLRDAFFLNELPWTKETVRYLDHNAGTPEEQGYILARELIRKKWKKLPEAVVVAADKPCMGVIQALHEEKIKYPDDIKIISYDGTDLCQNTSPTITSISPDCEKIGRMAILMIKASQNNTPDLDMMKPLLIWPKLIVRESA